MTDWSSTDIAYDLEYLNMSNVMAVKFFGMCMTIRITISGISI